MKAKSRPNARLHVGLHYSEIFGPIRRHVSADQNVSIALDWVYGLSVRTVVPAYLS